MGNKNDLKALASKKLTGSGLTLKDAAELGIKLLTPSQTQKLFKDHHRPALLFTYYTSTKKARTDTYRARLLGEPPPLPFGAVDPDVQLATVSVHLPPRLSRTMPAV